MRTSLARTLSGTVVAAAAVLALAGPANASTSPVKPVQPVQPVRLHTTLSIVESRTVIKAGQRDEISGRLASRGIGLDKRLVYLDRIYGHTLVPVRVGLTGPHGGISFSVWPNVTARYELVYHGNAVTAPTHSGVVTVRVKH
jgi:hypothetical protein